MVDFFVSYASPDQSWAEWIAWQLEAAGFSVVVQAWDFRPGHNFVKAIDEAVQTSRRTVLVLSPDYLSRPFPLSEWATGYAHDPDGRDAKLLPVRVRERTPAGLLGQVVYVDLVGLDEDGARQRLIRAVCEADSPRGRPAVAPAFPRLATPERPAEGGGRFVYAKLTARGIFDLPQVGAPYLAGPDATDHEGDGPPAVSAYVWLPNTEYLRSSPLQPFSPTAAVCLADPRRAARELDALLGPDGVANLGPSPGKMHDHDKERALRALGQSLGGCFAVAVTVPEVVLAIGRLRGKGDADLAYQALVNLFLLPLFQMHARLNVARFDVRLAPVGEKGALLLGMVKKLAKAAFGRAGSYTVDFVDPAGEEAAFTNLARLSAWAVGSLHNGGDPRWVSAAQPLRRSA